jgi:hypothetical protein
VNPKRQWCAANKNAIGCSRHDRFGIGRHDSGGFQPVLAAPEKGHQRGQLD